MAIDTWLPALLGYLIPAGVFLMGWGGVAPHRARRAATLGGLALALATVGYYVAGFALHLGGAEVMAPGQPGLQGLRGSWGPSIDWVLFGTRGFLLGGEVATPEAHALFVTYLPMVATAVLLPVLSASSSGRGWQVTVGGVLMGMFVFPLAACWVWGGGWLSQLGRSMNLGYGFVDHAGSAVVYLLGGAFALGALIGLGQRLPPGDPDQPDDMPPAHFPLLANLGVLVFGLGWLGWSVSQPFHVAGAQLSLPLIAVNGLLAGAGAALASQIYSWITVGHADPLMAARGAATGFVALSAGAPFVPTWAALLVGAVAGALFPLAVYLVRRVLRLPDEASAVSLGIVGGLLGTLAVPLFADGRWGQGWNGLVLDQGRLRAGQGVTGFFPAVGLGFIENGRGQSLAQLAGAGVIVLLGLLSGWLLLVLLTVPQRLRERASRSVEEREQRELPPAGDALAAAEDAV